MTVTELAEAAGRDVSSVFEALNFTDSSDLYTKPHSVIDNPKVVQDILKLLGKRFEKVAPPETEKKIENDIDRDVTRR